MADQDDTEVFRQAIANQGMAVLDLVDEDFPDLMDTYGRHVLLMKKELIARGMDAQQAVQFIVSVTAGFLFDG